MMQRVFLGVLQSSFLNCRFAKGAMASASLPFHILREGKILPTFLIPQVCLNLKPYYNEALYSYSALPSE